MRLLAQAALDKKARDLVVMDVRGRASYADWFIVASGNTRRQVRAIAENVHSLMKELSDVSPLGMEGDVTGRWALVDGGDVVVHIFEGPLRGYYDLDTMWIDAPHAGAEQLGLQTADTVQAAPPRLTTAASS